MNLSLSLHPAPDWGGRRCSGFSVLSNAIIDFSRLKSSWRGRWRSPLRRPRRYYLPLTTLDVAAVHRLDVLQSSREVTCNLLL